MSSTFNITTNATRKAICANKAAKKYARNLSIQASLQITINPSLIGNSTFDTRWSAWTIRLKS